MLIGGGAERNEESDGEERLADKVDSGEAGMNLWRKVLLDHGRRWLEDEAGQDLVEYALLCALLGLAAVATLRWVGTKVVASFTYISTTLNGSI